MLRGSRPCQEGEADRFEPGEHEEWPAGLDDLGERTPYLSWTQGATPLLTKALSDRVTITGSRASTSYGEHVTIKLATGMADEERIVIAGGSCGIEGAAHCAVLEARPYQHSQPCKHTCSPPGPVTDLDPQRIGVAKEQAPQTHAAKRGAPMRENLPPAKVR